MGKIYDAFVPTIKCIDGKLNEDITDLFYGLKLIDVSFLNFYETINSKNELIKRYFLTKETDKSLVIPYEKIAFEDLENLLILYNITNNQFDLTSIQIKGNYIHLINQSIQYQSNEILPSEVKITNNHFIAYNTKCSFKKYNNQFNLYQTNQTFTNIHKALFYVAGLTQSLHPDFYSDEIFNIHENMGKNEKFNKKPLFKLIIFN
jgi:hypothetical protein